MSDWRDKAACIEDPWPFYEQDREGFTDRMSREAIAKGLCAGCDVIQECLEDELRFDTVSTAWGIRGGLNADERKSLIRKRQRNRRKQTS